ncbi:serine carboxypeptidase S28-domain-containing protein [Abortiporus biennis]|nr:serine carboxypeptidase S28-domain-containing protein [Abortiporus biennis]
MVSSILTSLFLGFAFLTLSSVNAVVPPPRPSVPKIEALDAPVTSRNGTTLPPYTTVYEFDQVIDHDNPSLGTFKQRFWFTYEFYEPGGPIILFTPGEVSGDGYSGYLTNRTINGQIAQQQNGSAIVLEHRFFGLSNPKPDLTVASLRLLTIQQAIDDLEYFANNVHLPMPGGDSVPPGKAEWILVGGSYSGALTSWAMVNKPGLFKAGYASSAVVETILDYWGYFEPIRQNMPKNCSADVEAVISHIDQVLMGTDKNAITNLLTQFGMQALSNHLDDAAGALRNNLWDWQSLSPSTGTEGAFFKFCDALEVKNGKSASASGWGLDHALSAWATYWKNTYMPQLCGKNDVVDCLGSYDATQDYYTNTTVNNSNRSWFWMVCNEVGFLQESAPTGHPTLVSRLIQPIYDERQCQFMFPAAFPKPPTIDVEVTNIKYKGWDVSIDRLFFANGVRDPWREATVSADGVNVPSTSQQPIAVSDGFHCSDLSTANANVDSTVKAVQVQALQFMKSWITPTTSSSPSAPQYHYFKRDPNPTVHTQTMEEDVKPLRGIRWLKDTL